MFTVIFERPGCPYFCVHAKQLAEKLTKERNNFNFHYVDIHAEGITKTDLEKLSANQLKLHYKSSWMKNTLAIAQILKPTPKKT